MQSNEPRPLNAALSTEGVEDFECTSEEHHVRGPMSSRRKYHQGSQIRLRLTSLLVKKLIEIAGVFTVNSQIISGVSLKTK
jgi:hypothetical protein